MQRETKKPRMLAEQSDIGKLMSTAQTNSGDNASLSHQDMANAIRALSMDAVQAAKSGHPGMPLGMADVATVLFQDHLTFDASNPQWPNRDRFILSAGHGSMLLYSLLYLTGFPDMTIEQIKNFRQLGSKTAGHPEYGHAPGIETTTGPLGQGIANSVGMALAERMLNAQFGDDLIDYHTYCIAGDGCLMEGISHEAISLAGHLKLGKLIVLFDDNSISIDGSTDLSVSDDQALRFKASGWNTIKIDGHDPQQISKALSQAKADSSKPWLIACKTVIGYGAPTRAGTAKAHGEPFGAEEIAGTREKLGWPYKPFEIPTPILEAWRQVGAKGTASAKQWDQKLEQADPKAKQALTLNAAKARAPAIKEAITQAKAAFARDEKERATRVWSQMTIEHLVPVVPELIGGSADLSGSNGTKTKHHKAVTPSDFSGNYIHYGVREHAMAAAMNGIALSGLIPYGATFLVFTDYCRPAIRLSALMRQQVIYVMTHDSIGLGEDGPTHQPVEHLAALRAIPNLNVLRPGDPIETAECWQIALNSHETPSILVLTRQAVPLMREENETSNKSQLGAYVLHEPGKRDLTLLATGSEVGLAMSAAKTLESDGIAAAVVSMPSMELFRAQSSDHQNEVLGDVPRIGIEAAVEQGWREWLRPTDRFIGMSGFGASAPAAQLFEQFGITIDNVAKTARELVKAS